ncbi:MAG: hypothetical protein H8K07_04550 [Nitrospira sp.]|jgi:hypothetical protein|nr:hypothetical protein [Nitrospira sp.]MDI3464564.1 hypothetical protein [Nitrospira sp.]
MTPDHSPTDRTVSGTQPPAETSESDIYRHEPSGIMERSGNIPLWLQLVVFALLVWGLYYAWRYWNSY